MQQKNWSGSRGVEPPFYYSNTRPAFGWSLLKYLFRIFFSSLGNNFGDENNFYEVTLNGEKQEKTELFFGEMIPPPPRGVACLNFRYKKYQTGDFQFRLNSIQATFALKLVKFKLHLQFYVFTRSIGFSRNQLLFKAFVKHFWHTVRVWKLNNRNPKTF